MFRPRHTPSNPAEAPRADHALGRLLARLHSTAPQAGQADRATRHGGRAFTCAAEQCVMDLMTEDHAGLVEHSADVLTHLLEVWVASGIDPEDIWTEIDRRTRMGNLLLALNTAERTSVPTRARKRPWKIRTTKLP
ncbi:hypothetical protein B0W47_10210 [Komagataeibacter nataicola]|uniref:Phosphoribosyl-ATP pyrophosphatase n=1 Tax=Komagataeibacter nataicola TaxID=265960 RepID=A0A9N7CVJ0_9PROT|nr:hypothetical protein [Komagataeibacter nataicola]AQU87790.1 hypothetical protein B0W47_10210 [Komagataeibacter nataicola]PYD66186.1 hypothetical protein CDI09_09260 [Komagataeibacter nataicola]WEQ55533.1 hypothetical protein LV564_15900 [Komagataeibacter nataicola]WNM09612.1 hypothetical protein RI056_06705 [Komagataeibacter nataicola]GBR15711.1 phosphoribosyl ATP pyrophosphatase [Komagataeibacter nataicola NRIC 0616]